MPRSRAGTGGAVGRVYEGAGGTVGGGASRWRRARRGLAASALVASLLGSVVCTSEEPTAEPRTPVLVAAAPSLGDVLGMVEARFEAAHPEIDVVLTLEPASATAVRVEDGEAIDVVVAAADDLLATLAADGVLVGSPLPVATDRLAGAVPVGGPDDVAGFAQLVARRPLALCVADEVCGRAAEEALARAGLDVPSDAVRTPDAAAAVATVATGDAAAALVLRGDVLAATDEVRVVELPAVVGPTPTYRAAVLAGAEDPEMARAFADALAAPDAQAMFAAAGLTLP